LASAAAMGATIEDVLRSSELNSFMIHVVYLRDWLRDKSLLLWRRR